MSTTNTISQQMLDLLATRNFHPEMLDKMGKPTTAENAKTYTFDYVSGTGKNYGTMVIVLDVDNDMKIMYGDNLGRTMEGDDKQEFFDFIQHLNQKATSNRWTHTIQDINQLKHTMQGMAAIQEGLFEGYYGTRNISYSGQPTEARLRIVHSQTLGENDARYRHIDKLFVETADGEVFKLGFRNLSGGKAMLEHVRQGGKPYDIRGNHITEMVNEIAVLGRFNRASSTRILEGSTQELITEAQQYYKSLRENLKHLGSSRGYNRYFESWHPATINEQEGIVDNIKTLFIEQTIDSRIEAALPLLARIQQKGQQMKEADIFESWVNSISEGTWNLPETPEQLTKLKELMATELIVGPDATNATEVLYDIVGDDILFDRLHELADRDPRANVWNDTEVINRLKDLGIDLPEEAVPAADPNAVPAPVPAEQPPMAPIETPAPQVAEELNKMRKAAGLPVVESILDESGETLQHILDRFKFETTQFQQDGELDSDLYEALFDYYSSKGEIPYGIAKARDGDPHDWVSDKLSQHLGVDESNSGMIMPEADVIDTFEVMSGFDAPTVEGSCNMTAEGEYCPEHGLTECGGMYEMGTVAGSMAPIMDESATSTLDDVLAQYPEEVERFKQGADLDYDLESALWEYFFNQGDIRNYDADATEYITQQLADHLNSLDEGGQQAFVNKHHDDPINYNGAVTGSYYESKEGDAMLARIKSLALIK